MASNFAPGGSGVYRCQSNPAAWSARLYRVLLIPCIAFSGVTLQQSAVQAQSFMERRIQQRMEQRLAERRREEANLTDSQKQQLFEARRELAFNTYDQRLSLLESGQSCIASAQTYSAGQACREQQQKTLRRFIEESRQVMNNERQRLGLSPLPSVIPSALTLDF